jgi:hypothetical protein
MDITNKPMNITNRKKYGRYVYPYRKGDVYKNATAVEAVRVDGDKCTQCAFNQKPECDEISCHETRSRFGKTREADIIFVYGHNK